MSEAQAVQRGLPDEVDDTETISDSIAHLTNLIAQATLKYSVKDYDAAAELYSQATELQAEIYGEMSSRNADLLYAYGRCLYYVAVKNSDVLGTKVAGEKEDGPNKNGGKKPEKGQVVKEPKGEEERVAEEVVTKIIEEKDGSSQPVDDSERSKRPYFQFIGDENWDSSEEGENYRDGEDAVDAEEEDDFVNAYEVLDLARVLLLKKLEETEQSSSIEVEKSQITRQLKERLADAYDLQAEISLEGERFANAVTDLKSALALKLSLFPKESSLLAEAHYKLSLALEFSSVTQQKDTDGKAEMEEEAHVDESMREEAAEQMEAAIASCKLRMQREEANLRNSVQTFIDDAKSKVTEDDVEDVKEMVKEMEQRLVELRQPPVSVNDPTGLGTLDVSHPLNGILGSILGETPAAQKARLDEASEGAKDLTNLVKRKRVAESETLESATTDASQANGKRKLDSAEAGIAKKAKTVEGGIC